MLKIIAFLTLSSAYTTEYVLSTHNTSDEQSILEMHEDMLKHFAAKRAQLIGSSAATKLRRKLLDCYIEQLANLVVEIAAVA